MIRLIFHALLVSLLMAGIPHARAANEAAFAIAKIALSSASGSLKSACSGATPAMSVQATRIRFDALGRPVEVTLPSEAGEASSIAAVTRTSYAPLQTRTIDDLGAKAGIVDGAGIAKRHTLDILGRLVRIDDPDAGTLRFSYDDAGNVLREVDGRGRAVVHRYDGANRETESFEEGREAESKVAFTYDRAETCAKCTHTAGRVARVTYAIADGAANGATDGNVSQAAGTDELGYDARGNGIALTRTIAGNAFTFGTSFDNLGRLAERTLQTKWALMT